MDKINVTIKITKCCGSCRFFNRKGAVGICSHFNRSDKMPLYQKETELCLTNWLLNKNLSFRSDYIKIV